MSRPSRVLVIDDDLAIRLRVGDLVARTGEFVLDEAPDGPAGLAAARQHRPDLILLDIMMPGMTGIEVCAALRADGGTREIPVIVLSAAEESTAMISALEAGADDFLRKPFSGAELRAKIRTITRLNRYRALTGERDRFLWLLDHSQEPMIVANDRGEFLLVNGRAREVFGLGAEPVGDIATAIGRHFQTEPPEAWAAWREGRLPAGGSFSIHQPETRQVAPRWYDVELHALDSHSHQTLLKFTNHSGTVKRELETFTFHHLIAHKLRTPLNGLAPIFSFLAASESIAADEETAALLLLARESAERLEGTLVGILDFHSALFAPRAPGQSLSRRPLAGVVATAAAAADLAGRVRLVAPAGGLDHGELIEVVLTEVLENYAKFSAAREAGVAADWRRGADRWELRLFAPGPGLPPDIVAQLGRPYGQLERRFSGEVPGMGLGLATVRLLLRTIGGDMLFAHDPAATGLVTTLHLPLTLFETSPDHAGKSPT